MKIDGVVVLYGPTEENIKHIMEYVPVLNNLFVMDNTDGHKEYVKAFSAKNIKYVDMGGNRGIAQALRSGLDLAIQDGADFCLTMDQDSEFPLDSMPEIKKYLSAPDINDYGIIGLNIPGNTSCDKGLVETKTIITSGNFINIENYRSIDGFRSELFIDSVDFDLCHQFYKAGKKIAYIGDIILGHKIGDPCKKKIFGKTVTVSNHSAIRCYYRFRNNYLLYHEDKAFYKDIYNADKRQRLKICLFEKNKREKLRMIKLGIKHAKMHKLGAFEQGGKR